MSANPIQLGRTVMFTGEMTALRKKLGISKAALAEILGVAVTSLYRWESFGLMDQLNERNAEAVAQFWEAARVALDEFPDFAERFITTALHAQRLGVTNEWLLQQYRAGAVKLHDFGVLGLFADR